MEKNINYIDSTNNSIINNNSKISQYNSTDICNLFPNMLLSIDNMDNILNKLSIICTTFVDSQWGESFDGIDVADIKQIIKGILNSIKRLTKVSEKLEHFCQTIEDNNIDEKDLNQDQDKIYLLQDLLSETNNCFQIIMVSIKLTSNRNEKSTVDVKYKYWRTFIKKEYFNNPELLTRVKSFVESDTSNYSMIELLDLAENLKLLKDKLKI